MEQEVKKATFGTMKTMRHHRRQMERKNQEIGWMLTGLDRPLLPEQWTEEDAWKLADALTELIRQIVWVSETEFCKENPYPSHDTLLKDIPYYNSHFLNINPDPAAPPYTQEDIDIWRRTLYCGILLTANYPEFLDSDYNDPEPCSVSRGTFADLKELLTGTIMTMDGPKMVIDTVLSRLDSSISENRYLELKEEDFSPEPPKGYSQLLMWNEWIWLDRHPCRGELRNAMDLVQSEELHGDVMRFIYTAASSYLSLAIDLYLYQTDASSMLDDSYYVTYAMLCRTQEQIKAAMADEEG